MKSSKKEMKKRLLALLLCITMVMNGGISTFAEGSEQSGHTHTEACYTNVETKELVCKVPEEEAHMHGPSCYTENKQLTCAIEASEGHVHTEECVGVITEAVTGNVCQLEEGAEHTHTEECVGVISEAVTGNVCGLEESEGHAHGDECYTVSSELTCTVPETEGHKHVDECYHVIPAGTLVCTLAETADETQKGAPSDICKCGNPECTCETCEEGCTCETAEKDEKAEETENKEETKQPEKTEYSVEGGETTPKVSITLADAAHIPDEAVLEVDSVTLTDEEAAAIEGAAKAEGIYSENVTALDICFELEVVDEETGETTLENPQPLDGNEVNVAVALPGIEADDEVSVYHLGYETVTDENGEEKEVLKVEDMDASVNAETGAVEFKTPHFSIYVFVENADTAVAAIMEMLEALPTVETVESELLAYAEAEDWDGYKEYYVEIGTAGKTVHDAYAALTDEEKANIENVEKLTALETIWSAEDLESAAEVAVVIAMIDQLPTYEEVAEALTKLEAEEDWEGYEKYIKALAKKAWPAYYAYEALSEEQKALVTNYERLMETSGVWGVVTLEESVNVSHNPKTCKKHDSAMPELIKSTVDSKAVDPGLEVDKRIVATKDPNEFDLILEAYATGDKAAIPMDIVMVMDASGSMSQSRYYLSVDKMIPGYTYFTHDYDNLKYKDGTLNLDKGVTYGYKKAYPSPVTWCDTCKAWIKENHDRETNEITGYEVVAREDGISKKYRFFETNMQATERSVREFLNAIIENGNITGADHRISMMSYNGDQACLYTNSAELIKYKDSDGIVDEDLYAGAFVSVSDTNSILKFLDAYSNITYPYFGNTPTHLGMIMAQDALSKKPKVADEKIARQELVVLFADGAPGEDTNINNSWEKTTKDKSSELKAKGVNVFTVGFYDDASTSSSEKTKKYYERSDQMFREMASNNCFFRAVDATELSVAFRNIADKFASQPLIFDAATVMREEISKYFVLDVDTDDSGEAKRDIKVETAKCTGKNENEFVFSDKTVPAGTGVTAAIVKTTSSPATDVINVTGFNYGSEDNSVKSYTISDGTTKYEGKKLILTVPIETREGFWGGNNVPTNDSTTALYHPKEGVSDYKPTEPGLDKLTRLVSFPMPEANVPMTINIEAQDKTIYYAGAVNATDLVKGITAGYTEKGEEWVKPATPVTVNADGTLTPKEDWMDDYATITWADTSTQPMKEIDNKNCGTYDYDVVMASKNNTESSNTNKSGHPGRDKDGGAIAGTAAEVNEKLSQAEATGNVHILIPTITFKDSVVDLGFKTSAKYYNENNKVGEVKWSQLDTTHTNIPPVSGTEPTFAYGYTPASQEIFLDTPVDVVVSYKGRTDVTSDELMAVTTFNWEECKETDYHHETENINSHRGIAASYEFWIHTNDVYELPSTGGMGTYLYTLGGVVLMMGTSLMAYKKKRKEVLRSR